MKERTGISNRESPEQEARERQEFPPKTEGSPPPEDASGRNRVFLGRGPLYHLSGSDALAGRNCNMPDLQPAQSEILSDTASV